MSRLFGMELLFKQILKWCFGRDKSFIGEVRSDAEAHNETVEIGFAKRKEEASENGIVKA